MATSSDKKSSSSGNDKNSETAEEREKRVKEKKAQDQAFFLTPLNDKTAFSFQILQDKGLINVNKMCNYKNTVPYHFLRTKEGETVLQCLKSSMSDDEIMVTDRTSERRGIWATPVLAAYIAAWLSPKMLDSLLKVLTQRAQSTVLAHHKSDIIMVEELKTVKLEKADAEIAELKKNLRRAEAEVRVLTEKLEQSEKVKDAAVTRMNTQLQVAELYNTYENDWKTVYDYVYSVYRIRLTETEVKNLDKQVIEAMQKRHDEKFYVYESTQMQKWQTLVDRNPSFKPDCIPPPMPKNYPGFSIGPHDIHVIFRTDWDLIEDFLEPIIEKHKKKPIF